MPPTDRRRSAAAIAVLVVGLACRYEPPQPTGALTIGDGEVSFRATVSAAGFASGMAGYHLVVWKGGRAAHPALFRSEATDIEVLDALERLGAVPGDALGIDSWEEREDESSTAPEEILEGPPVEIVVRVPGRQNPLRLEEFLTDPGGRGFDMRFGGHRENIPKWRSGCVACLYSCPGSKVGNAAYTIRDYMKGTTEFQVRPGILPPDGSEVEIVLRLAETIPSN